MNDDNQIALMILVAGFINWLAQVQRSKDGTPVVVGNIVLFVVLILLASVWRSDVSKLLAALYLLTTFLRDGTKLIAQILAILKAFGATV